MPLSKALESDQEMLFFLNEASEILFTSLTLEDELIFDEISRLIVPRLADWFAIDVYDEKNGFNMLTVAHKDPEKIKWAYEWRKQYPPEYENPTGLGAVIRTGEPEVYYTLTDETLSAFAKDANHLKIIYELGLQSIIIVPLKTRNVTFGAITFVSTRESERNYAPRDLAPIESFAKKVAIAIDNKMLYNTAQREVVRRKENEAKVNSLLTESKLKQKWLDEFIRTIPGMVWETELNREDNSQNITFISEYAERMMGYPLEDWYNIPNFWNQILHPEDAGKITSDARQTFLKGSGQNQYRWISRSGESIWTETKSFVLYNEKQEPIGMRGISFDITRLKELESRKDEFIGIASHELKTPITSAKIITQCLQENAGEISPTNQYLIEKLDKQLDKLIFLINAMLDMNRLQEGSLQFRDEPFDINQLIKDLAETYSILYPNKINITGLIKDPIMADKERITQIIVNLLNNAVKYSEKGKDIQILLKDSKKSVDITVEDQGVGIEPQYLDKVFEKFFRVPDPSVRFVSGMGIGLNICQQIVTHYNGRIQVKSIPGKGSSFRFSLPV